MNLFTAKRDFPVDIEHIRHLSGKIEKKISQLKSPDEYKLEKLSIDELQDLNKILCLTDFMLCKYEEKKETCSILRNFVSVIQDSAKSIENLDDEISELIVSAEDSINKVKDMHANIYEKSDIDYPKKNPSQQVESSSINLTNFTTEINTVEYQQNSTEETAQVI